MQLPLSFWLIIGEAVGVELISELESWARVHLAPASPQEVCRPDDPTPPTPPLCLLSEEPPRSPVNKQSVQAALSGLLAAH